MMPTAASNIIEQIVNAIVSVGAAWILFDIGLESGRELAFGAAGGTIGTGAGALAALIFTIFIYLIKITNETMYYQKVLDMKKKIRRDTVSSLQPVRNIYKMLLITILPVIFSTAVYNISGLLDGQIFSNVEFYKGVEESVYSGLYGIYSSKYRVLMNVPIAIASALAASIIPTLVASMTMKEYKSVKHKIDYSIRFSMIIAIPCAVGLAVLSGPIISLIWGPDPMAAEMMQIGAVSVVFYSLSTITNAVLQGIDKMRIPVIHAGISVVTHIIILIVMLWVFDMSIQAVVVADALFALLICVLNGLALKKYIRYKQEYIKTFLLPGIAAAVMGAVAYYSYTGLYKITGSNVTGIGIAVLFAVLVYGLLLLAFKVVNEDEIRSMPKGAVLVKTLKKFHML